MRVLCNGFGWFDAARGEAAAAGHDVVVATAEQIAQAWTEPRADWWRALAPAGWEPDVALFCCPEYCLAPPHLADLPCPTALWVGDWYVNAQAVHALAPQVDLVLADAAGVRALRASGIDHVDECCPWTFDPQRHRPDWHADPVWDVGFLGNVNDAIQHERNRWLARLADLPAGLRVRAGGGVYGDDYVRFLQRTRITFNRSVTGDVNMRCFEATACGTLVLVERENVELARWFEPGHEVVTYDESDFEDVVAHYLAHEDERRAVARAGWERVQQHAPAPRLRGLLDRLAQMAGAGVTRQLTATTPAAGGAAALQAIKATDTDPWEGAELMLERAEQAAPEDPAVQVVRGALYASYAASVPPEQTADVVGWALGHNQRALALHASDAVAHLNQAEIAVAVGDVAAARALAEQLIASIDAGTSVARPDRPLFPMKHSRASMEWQRAILAGTDVEAALTRLALGAACRLAARHHPDPEARVALYERALDCLDLPRERLALATELAALGRSAAALDQLERVLAAEPLLAEAWEPYVGALVAAGRHAEADRFVGRCRRIAALLTMRNGQIVDRLAALVPLAA